MSFSLKDREQSKAFVKENEVDVLIIGGGITGAGVAIQAAASGMSTALVEMQDFAEGTSSRSTKLVHGGIRYLKNFDVEVVSDTVSERAIVQQIAPHIPKADPMLLPIYDEPGATFSMFSVKVAMDLYDRLAGVTGTAYENKVLTKEEVLEREPQLKEDKLLGGGVYLDFRNNDARLVIENIKQAQRDGGHMLSRTKVIGFTYHETGKISGAIVEDLVTGEEYTIKARVVINTTGPWSDTIRQLAPGYEHVSQMRPTKGVHLVVDRSKLNVPQPTYFDTGRGDGRMVFVVPREEKTYFGTTDTDYDGDFKHPTVTQEDVDYLISIVNHRFPETTITLEDVEASWAGLRPLLSGNGGSDYNGGNNGSLTEESLDNVVQAVESYVHEEGQREDVEKAIKNVKSKLVESDANPSAVSRGSSLDVDDNGLLTLAGGKITDYRLMAEGALALITDILASDYDKDFTPIDSKQYQVSGGRFDHSQVEESLAGFAKELAVSEITEEEALFLAHLYGSNSSELLNYQDVLPGLTKAQSMSLNYALHHEMVLTPVDYFLRRTNYLLFMRDQLDQIDEAVVNAMSAFYGWSKETKDKYWEELKTVMAESSLEQLKKG